MFPLVLMLQIEDEELPSRTTSFQEGEDDADIDYTPSTTTEDTALEDQAPLAQAPSPQAPPRGPITRARARELNYIVVLKNEGSGAHSEARGCGGPASGA